VEAGEAIITGELMCVCGHNFTTNHIGGLQNRQVALATNFYTLATNICEP